MMVQPPPATSQLQRFANDISARLAQLAKDPPDLLAYLQVHAECLISALRPVGFVYEMQNGTTFQRTLLSNVESLNYKNLPEQDSAFARAVRLSAEKRQAVFIANQTLPSAGVHGLAVEDAPAPDELPLFNRTPFEQMFVPILLGQSTVGVLHIWFHPADDSTNQARLALLKRTCGEVELYLKARRLSDISQEVTRLSTYSRLLEELTGDLDLESVSWNIVNYAREAVSCDRVCLFVARDYERNPQSRDGLDYEFELFACSGLKRPHPRSEQAVILQRVAQKLTQLSLSNPALRSASASAPQADAVNGAHPVNGAESTAALPVPAPATVDQPADAKTAEAPERAGASTTTQRPKMQLTLMARDPAKVAKRPPEVNEYFELMPMNWATVLPLFDRENRVCGIVLFEGVKPAEKLDRSFLQMRDLAVSAGRALGTALHWNRQPSLRLAQSWVGLRQSYVNTPTKRKWLRFGLPTLLVIALLLAPIPFKLKGDATVLPVQKTALPALVSARLVEVLVQEGDAVTAGQALARLDTRDLELELRQLEQEYERALVEGDTALNLGRETEMQLARLAAAKARAMAEKIRQDIERATLRAPFDGIVLGAQTLSTRIGEVARIGEPMLEVVNPHEWQVKVNLREQDLIYLDRYFTENGTVDASLKLAANPAKTYELAVTSPEQLAYGLDTARNKYEFVVMLPMTEALENPELMKAGFAGRAKFETGTRPIAYVLFRDFVHFVRVRWL